MPTPGSRLGWFPSVIVNAREGCGGRWVSSPQSLAKEPSALWTLIRGDQAGSEARLAEGEPGLRGSRLGVFDPFHWARRDAKHARLPLSVTATAVTPSPPGKGASPLFVRALGRGSPTVAPLRVGLCAPP